MRNQDGQLISGCRQDSPQDNSLSGDQRRILDKIRTLKKEGPAWQFSRTASTTSKPILSVYKLKHVTLNTLDADYADELKAWTDGQLASASIEYPWGPATSKAKKQLDHMLLLIPVPIQIGIGRHEDSVAGAIMDRILESAKGGIQPREAAWMARQELAPSREWLVSPKEVPPKRGNITIRVRHAPRTGPPMPGYVEWKTLTSRTRDPRLLGLIVDRLDERLNAEGGNPRVVLDEIRDSILHKV